MSSEIASGDLLHAVLAHVDTGAFPDSEDVVSAELPASVLPALLADLQKARDQVKTEIRELSQNAAPDVDDWIGQAKRLQADIERSKATAREIVQQAEIDRKLKDEAFDVANKASLLEKEVAFNETLVETLERIKTVCGILNDAEDAIIRDDVQGAFAKVEEADNIIPSLEYAENTRAYGLLHDRHQNIKAALIEKATETTKSMIQVSKADLSTRISQDTPNVSGVNLETTIGILSCFDALTPYLKYLRRELDVALIRPRLGKGFDQELGSFQIDDNTIHIVQGKGSNTLLSTIDDVWVLVEFLETHLPSSIRSSFSPMIMSSLMDRLTTNWLDACIPTNIEEMPLLQEVIDRVSVLAQQIDGVGWTGTSILKEWVQSAPRTWLSKRRETALGAVRKLLFSGLREKNTVEKIETQMISKGDVIMGEDHADDAWNAAWDSDANQAAVDDKGSATTGEDDDASAWDMDDTEEANPNLNAGEMGAGEDDAEAWGWEEEEKGSTDVAETDLKKGNVSNAGAAKAAKASAEEEVTLKETYTVTAVPDGILEIVVHVVADAETLTDPSYAQTPIASVASALYTLPTLALAMYRATASTAYGKLDSGNMLIYNDSTRLSDEMRIFLVKQAEKDSSSSLTPNVRPSSRIKLDNDLKALDSFAKRAYSTEMESQRTILGDMLDGAQGFVNCTVPPFADACESSTAITASRLHDVYKLWEPVLSRSVLLQSIGSLTSTVTSKMIADIEDLPDIGEEESKRLRGYCDKISEVKALFVQEHPHSGESGDMTGIYCPNWFKFQYLAEILESSLADIKYMWIEGELRLEFDAEEVTDLIQALFADSDYRRKAIADIRRAGR